MDESKPSSKSSNTKKVTLHWSSKKRICWSSCYVLTWILLVFGLITYHMAISKVVPPLKDLPKNLKTGFYDTFKFNDLSTDSNDTKYQSIVALAKCNVIVTMTTGCDASITSASSGSGVSLNTSANASCVGTCSNTATEKSKIDQNFQSSLTMVKQVCNDQYFGTPDLKKTGNDLNNMTNILADIPVSDSPCVLTNPMYCSMWTLADTTVAGVAEVNTAIDGFINNPMAEKWTDYADYLTYLHALPYILVLSSLCFCFGWQTQGSCYCCCKSKGENPTCPGAGGKKSCMWVIPHAFFWLIFLVINTIIVAVGYVVKNYKDQVEMDMLEGKPNLEQFIDHVQAVYPAFWKVVFLDMEEGLAGMWFAAALFEVFCIIIVSYGCCMCCWRPYRDVTLTEVQSFKDKGCAENP